MKPSEVFPESVRRAAPRVRASWRRLADLWPFTALGMALGLVACIALFSFGFGKLDLVLLVLGYGGVGLLTLSSIVVVLSTIGIRLALRRSPSGWSASTFETGTRLPTGFSLPSVWWFPLVQVRW
ncbi:MAG: hypothetical protein WBM48_01265, partial [Polyangiales bacterium]